MDETPLEGEQAPQLALRLAIAKARAGRAARPAEALVLGADTVVTVGGLLLGKAASEHEAIAMLSQLSDREHEVVTAVALSAPDREFTAISRSRVRMRLIAREEALAYWRSGEPAGKAGAYAIQGVGGVFVQTLSGSWSGVVGLPVFETAGLLKEAGIDLLRVDTAERRR